VKHKCSRPQAGLFVHPGHANLCTDSSLPAYDATDLLVKLVLDLLVER
jgi:hypothetical protein